MLTLIVVISFPFLLAAGYTLLYFLSNRRLDVLIGAPGFALYLILLTIPLGFVLATHMDRVTGALEWKSSLLLWMPCGIALGAVLWGVQKWGLPGRMPEADKRAWVGPPGRLGFFLLLIPVAYIVLSEELVWRAYLIPETGWLLSAVLFALHHYHFGLRHVVFACLAGLVWGGLFLLPECVWPAAASHFIYNIFAWRHMRRQSKPLTAGNF